jgi:polyphenol oxidase
VTEAFSFLHPISTLNGFQASWIPRIPHINVSADRETALRNLSPHHNLLISQIYPKTTTRHHAEQIHSNHITVISSPNSSPIITHPDSDGLITNIPNNLLAIYVADCAAIYLTDPVTKSIALLHSGKKGTESNILANAVSAMTRHFGTNPSDLICILSPCIRPPHYEIDIASTIASQAANLGISSFHDSCENTATDLNKHYSYRIEKGQTGRMLALLTIQ